MAASRLLARRGRRALQAANMAWTPLLRRQRSGWRGTGTARRPVGCPRGLVRALGPHQAPGDAPLWNAQHEGLVLPATHWPKCHQIRPSSWRETESDGRAELAGAGPRALCRRTAWGRPERGRPAPSCPPRVCSVAGGARLF